jgi:hypothetical protein
MPKPFDEWAEGSKPKVLVVDIETAPTLAWMWQQWQGNIVATEQDWYILCFAFKWLGGDDIGFVSLPDRKGWKSDSSDDRYVTKELWKLFDKADVIIAHNGDKFDIRKVQARFLFHRLGPTSTFQSIDTLKVYRKHFALMSNSLKEIARYLGLEDGKLEHEGFSLWRSCMAGDKEAWGRMEAYNVRDVEVLEAAYLEVQPWVIRPRPNSQVNFAHWRKEGGNICPACGREGTLRRKGWKRTGVSEFPELWCKPKLGGCGARPRMRYRKAQYDGGVKAQ